MPLPYKKLNMIVQKRNHFSIHRHSPYEKSDVIVQMQNYTSTYRHSPYEKPDVIVQKGGIVCYIKISAISIDIAEVVLIWFNVSGLFAEVTV